MISGNTDSAFGALTIQWIVYLSPASLLPSADVDTLTADDGTENETRIYFRRGQTHCGKFQGGGGQIQIQEGAPIY